MAEANSPAPGDAETFPAVTVEQMIDVDRLMIEEFGVDLLQMMENAGHRLASLCQAMLDKSP
ncbi:MAG: hypothetical protein CL878_04795, partial [Dehalococcoidia bacterium]|nr:hypothetical protein [Dehalococcoidia bacterium]